MPYSKFTWLNTFIIDSLFQELYIFFALCMFVPCVYTYLCMYGSMYAWEYILCLYRQLMKKEAMNMKNSNEEYERVWKEEREGHIV